MRISLNLKLTTISWLFVGLMLLSCVIISSGALFIHHNVQQVDKSWEQLENDRSEKARLESTLRTAIGFGGMIHHFKNYLLRHNPDELFHIQNHIAEAKGVLLQYRALVLSPAEKQALSDIETVINNYTKASHNISALITQGLSIAAIDEKVRIDDTPALSGLTTLRHEVQRNSTAMTTPSKGRIAADLRAATGYGGMIHAFKNYLLRHDERYYVNAIERVTEAQLAINSYRQLYLNASEKRALQTIEKTLDTYATNIHTMKQLIEKGVAHRQIDAEVRTDDKPMLEALLLLDQEINRQIAERSQRVATSLHEVGSTTP